MEIIELLFPDALQRDSSPATGRIDELGQSPEPFGPAYVAEASCIRQGTYVRVRGWAIDTVRRRPAAGVMVRIGEQPYVSARYGDRRDDIAEHFASPALAQCGFTALLSTDLLAPGPHDVVAAVVDRSIQSYALLGAPVAVTIARSALQVEIGNAEISGATAHSVDAIRASGSLNGGPRAEIDWSSEIVVEGWAVDTAAGDIAAGCYVEIDGGRHFVRALYGFPRPDVADALHEARYTNCGYRAYVSGATVGLGTHTARLLILNADGAEYYRSDRMSEFTVLPPP